MAKSNAIVGKLRKICLALPDTQETITWGKPHFRVNDKIFAGFDEESGAPTLGVKLEKSHAEALVGSPGFERAPYVGRHGWVSVDVKVVNDWQHIEALIHESFGLIAPKRTLAKLKPR